MLNSLALALCAALAARASLPAPARVGVLFWSDEPRYLEAFEGVKEQLAKEGYGPGAVEFIVRRSGVNRAVAEDQARELRQAKVRLLLTFGTTGTAAALKGITDVPVVYSVVYDPVEAGLAAGWERPGRNATGASSMVPMGEILSVVKSVRPVRAVAVLYTPGEKNTEQQLLDMQKAASSEGVTIIPLPFTSESSAGDLVPRLAGKAEVLFIGGSARASKVLGEVFANAGKAGLLTVTHLADVAEQGAVLGVCAASRDVGQLAGQKAAAVLAGADPSSIPVGRLRRFELIVNRKAAAAAGIALPEALLKRATRTSE